MEAKKPAAGVDPFVRVKALYVSGLLEGTESEVQCRLSEAEVGRVVRPWIRVLSAYRVLEVFSPYSAEQEWEIAVACWDAALDEDDQHAAGEWAGRCAAKLEKEAGGA